MILIGDMGDDQQTVHAYLTGALSESEAEAFEERLMADDELARELQRAVEIRAAMGGVTDVRRPRDRKLWKRSMIPLALAAGVAIAGLGIVWVRQPAAPTPVFRGIEQHTSIVVEVVDGIARVSWAAVAGAREYELRLIGRDGELLRTLTSGAPRAEIALPTGDGTQPVQVEIVALDAFGQTIVRSDRVDLQR